MSYVDRYADAFREAADRRARRPLASRLPRRFARPLVAAVAAVALIVLLLPGLRSGERAAAPPPDDPRVARLVGGALSGEASTQIPCRPPRGRAGLSDAPPRPETRAALGVLRRPGRVPPRLLRELSKRGDPRAAILVPSARVLRAGGRDRAVLYVMRGPRFAARDPEACDELIRGELDQLARRQPEAVTTAARDRLEGVLEQRRSSIADDRDQLFLSELTTAGHPGGGAGGGSVEQLRRGGMGSSSVGRPRGGGPPFRVVSGLVPDGVAEVEIVARGAGDRPWVRRHRVRVEDNFFLLERFHAATFGVRWLDAAGREIERG